MVKQFTQDEINKISGVYKKKYGGDENAFRADIEKQYGTGAFDTVKSAMKGAYEAYKSQTPAVNAAAKIAQKNLGVTADEANKIAEKTYGNVAGTNTTQTPGGILPPKGENSYVVGTEPASSVTPVNTSAIKTSEDAAQAVTDATKANISATSQAATDYQNAMNVRTEEDKKLAEEQKAQAEAEAAKKEAVYIETDKKVADLENQLSKLIEERKTRDVADLEAKKQSEVDKLNADQELQKWKDEQSVKKAEQQVETEKLKASFAFNRLGLGFSSYAVGTVNRIATEGATAIAGLKLQASANQATFAKDVANLEFNYTKEINQTIDVYTDKSIALKEASIKRIKELELNILATDKEKNDAIRDITKEYLANKRENEDNAYREFERLRDKQLDQARELQAQMAAQEKIQIAKGEMMIANGSWLKMTPAQKAEYETNAGLPVGTLDAQMNTNINTLITNVLDRVMGQGFLLPNRENVMREIQSEMRNGRDLASATTIVMERVLKNNPEYIAKQNQIKAEQNIRLQTSQLTNIKALSELKGQGYLSETQFNTLNKNVGETGGECGTFARQATGLTTGLDALVGKTANERIKSFTDAEPVVGGMALFTGGKYNSTYGHIAVVTGVNDDGTVNIKESNLKEDGRVTERTVNASEIKGFYNNTPLAKAKNVSSGNDALIASEYGIKLDTTHIKNIKGMTEEEKKNYFEGLKKKTTGGVDGISEEDKGRIDALTGGATLTPEQYKNYAGKSDEYIKNDLNLIDKNIGRYTEVKKLLEGELSGKYSGKKTNKDYFNELMSDLYSKGVTDDKILINVIGTIKNEQGDYEIKGEEDVKDGELYLGEDLKVYIKDDWGFDEKIDWVPNVKNTK